MRPYTPADREAVRRICCDTGLAGGPVDPMFADREVFADFLTRYYTDWEPQSSLVAEVDGEVVGYLTGCLRYQLHSFVQPLIVAQCCGRALWRLATGSYGRESRDFLAWCFLRAHRETPEHPRPAGHFHFNLLPDHRNRGLGRRLLSRFLHAAAEHGVRRVYGRIQTGERRRGDRVFERFGFRLVDRRQVSKFRRFSHEVIYASTFARELVAPPAAADRTAPGSLICSPQASEP